MPVNSMEHSLSMIQLKEPPIISKPSENETEQEAVEIAITKLLLKSYNIVRKNIEDAIPKVIMHFLVNHTKRDLHNVLIRKLYRESLFEEMLREPDDIAARRKHTGETLRVLEQAYRTLDELPLEAETMEREYSSTTDSMGLPRMNGVSSSMYASANDYSSLYSASPRNRRSRTSLAHSGEQSSPAPFYSSAANEFGSYPNIEA